MTSLKECQLLAYSPLIAIFISLFESRNKLGRIYFFQLFRLKKSVDYIYLFDYFAKKWKEMIFPYEFTIIKYPPSYICRKIM